MVPDVLSDLVEGFVYVALDRRHHRFEELGVFLTTDLVHHREAHAVVLQGVKRRTRADRVKLFGVSKQHHLRRFDPVHDVHEITHLAGVDHRGFIDDDELVGILACHRGERAGRHSAL